MISVTLCFKSGTREASEDRKLFDRESTLKSTNPSREREPQDPNGVTGVDVIEGQRRIRTGKNGTADNADFTDKKLRTK